MIELLKELKFIRCEKGKYFRKKIYENVFLEIDTEDWFASLVKIDNRSKRPLLTKIYLPNKLSIDRLTMLTKLLGLDLQKELIKK